MIHKKKNILVTFTLSLILLLLLSYPLFSDDTPLPSTDTEPHAAADHMSDAADTAAHGEEGGHSADRSGDIKDFYKRVFNFTAMVIILVVIMRKTKLLNYFSERSEGISKKLDDLKRDKEEAERKYKEIEEQLKNFEAERDDIIEQYRKEGITEKDRIVAEAKERVEQIIAQSELTIEQEIESARNQLKQDIVDIASKRAQDILVKEMNENDQEKMVIEFVEKVGKVN